MATTAVAVSGLALLVAGMWFAWRRFAPRPQPEERQLTTNPMGLPILGAAISPDGKSLLYADSTGMYLKNIASGETDAVPPPPGVRFSPSSLGWFPDGARLIVTSRSERDSAASGVWQVSLVGWKWRRLEAEGKEATVSPDGARIAFTRGDTAIWMMNADGADANRIYSLKPGELVSGAAWAPDGARIAYVRYPRRGDIAPMSIETLDPARHDVSVIVKDPKLRSRFGGVATPLWMPDGRILYSLSDSVGSRNQTLWQARVGSRDGRPRGRPGRYARLTSSAAATSASADGRRVVVLKRSAQMDVHVADLEAGGSRLHAPRRLTLDDRDDHFLYWSRDGQTVQFTSDRQGPRAAFRQRMDRSTSEVVVSLMGAPNASETPDGRWILFRRYLPGAPIGTWRIMRMAAAGGPAETVMTCSRLPIFHCPFRRDAECIMCENDSAWSTFSTLDAERGRGREVARIARGRNGHCSWALSPDGTRLAWVFPLERDIIRVMDLRTRRTTVIGMKFTDNVEPGGYLQNVCFAGPSERDGLIASAFTHLLHVDAAGHVMPLHQVDGWFGNPQVSPDGKHLAWNQLNVEANAWLLETP